MKLARNRPEILQLHHLKVAGVRSRNALETVVAVGCGILEREGARDLRVARPDDVSTGVEQRPVRFVVRTVEFPFRGPPGSSFRSTVHIVAVHDRAHAEVVVHLEREIGLCYDDALGVIRAGSRIVVVEEVGGHGGAVECGGG